MNEIIKFNFHEQQVRTMLDDNNQPMFVAKDIATILGYADTNKAINTHCDGAVILRTVSDSLGRSQEMRVIYEPDLYRLIFGSKLPSAQQFQKWVFEEVLPSIRAKGSYNLTDNPPLTYMESLELLLKKEKERQLLLDSNQKLVTQKEQAKLENGKSILGATVSQVNKKLGTDFKWQPLQRYCENESIPPEIIYPNGYTSISAKAYPYQAWFDVYELDLNQVFGERYE